MTRNPKSMNRTVWIGCLAMGLAQAAHAQTKMYFDFGGNTGTEAGLTTTSPDANGNHWNNMWVPFIANTIDTTGAPSGIGIGFVSNYGANGGVAGGGLFAPDSGLLGDFAIETVTQDYYYCTPLDVNLPQLVFDMWGYDDAATVNFKFFASSASFEDQQTLYTVHGGNGDFSGSVTTSGFGIGGGGLLDGNDDTVVEINGVQSVGGLITIDVDVLLGSFGYINGMMVEIIDAVECQADTNGDGILDNGDIGVFVQLFLGGDLAADFNGDGILDNGDIGAFVAAFLGGC